MSSPSSLDEMSNSSLRLPLWDKASAEFYFAKSRELLTRPFPSTTLRRNVPHSSCRNLTSLTDDNYMQHQLLCETQFQNLSFEDHYYRPHTQYRDKTLTKSENLTRKQYTSSDMSRYRHDGGCGGFYRNNANGSQYFETSYVYYKTDMYDDNLLNYTNELKNVQDRDLFGRQRTLSFSEVQQQHQQPFHEKVPKRGRSIRDRNRRRQSYNPQVYESSSSDSDCISVGSVDLDWRRRKRLSRFSASNTSIRSEIAKRNNTNPFLKPQFSCKLMGRSPPPSSSILSGLSPTSAARCQQRSSNSTSSDSSL